MDFCFSYDTNIRIDTHRDVTPKITPKNWDTQIYQKIF